MKEFKRKSEFLLSSENFKSIHQLRVMHQERKFDVLQEVAENILGLRCIFPAADRSNVFRGIDEQCSARCMLELPVETTSTGQKIVNSFEDIVQRVRLIGEDEEKTEVLQVCFDNIFYG